MSSFALNDIHGSIVQFSYLKNPRQNHPKAEFP